jgi:hypothetical protein
MARAQISFQSEFAGLTFKVTKRETTPNGVMSSASCEVTAYPMEDGTLHMFCNECEFVFCQELEDSEHRMCAHMQEVNDRQMCMENVTFMSQLAQATEAANNPNATGSRPSLLVRQRRDVTVPPKPKTRRRR